LAGNSAGYTVTGFDQLPRTERSSRVLHTFFDVKMTMLDIVAVLLFGYLGLYIFKRKWLTKRVVLAALSFGGVAAVTMVELGWMITEIGRQPWAVRGYVTTEQAITSSHTVAQFAYIFPLMYVVLFIVTGLALRKIISHERRKGGTLA
jgi:cytochrome d ubiquinol oxidase subunit I